MKCKHSQYLGAEVMARVAQWLQLLMTMVAVSETQLQAHRAAVPTEGFCIVLVVSGHRSQELLPQRDTGESH